MTPVKTMTMTSRCSNAATQTYRLAGDHDSGLPNTQPPRQTLLTRELTRIFENIARM